MISKARTLLLNCCTLLLFLWATMIVSRKTNTLSAQPVSPARAAQQYTGTDDVTVVFHQTSPSGIPHPRAEQHTCHEVQASILCTATQHRRFLDMCDLFAVFVEVARAAQLNYILSDGTLLGYVRGGTIIPHDTDVDVIIYQEHYATALPALEAYNMLGTPYVWILHPQWRLKSDNLLAEAKADPATHRTRTGVGFMAPNARFQKRTVPKLHIDVFPLFDNDSDPTLLERFARTANWHLQSLPRSSMLPPVPCIFMGLTTLCPPDPMPYLVGAFGPTWNNSDKVCKNGQWITNIKPPHPR